MTLIYEQKTENLISPQLAAKLTGVLTTSLKTILITGLEIRHTLSDKFEFQLPVARGIMK